MKVWKISEKCDDRNSVIVDLKTSGSFKVCSGILSYALSARPHESQQPSFTALSFRAMFLENTRLEQFVY